MTRKLIHISYDEHMMKYDTQVRVARIYIYTRIVTSSSRCAAFNPTAHAPDAALIRA